MNEFGEDLDEDEQRMYDLWGMTYRELRIFGRICWCITVVIVVVAIVAIVIRLTG